MNLKPTASGRPLLDRRAFQQLLSAAYTLQQRNDRMIRRSLASSSCPLDTQLPLEGVLPVAQYEVQRFEVLNDFGRVTRAACKPSALPLEPQSRQIVLPDSESPFERIAPVPEKLLSVACSTVSKGMKILGLNDVRRPSVWRLIEAVAIAAVFCGIMLTASINRLSAFPAEPPRPTELVGGRAYARTAKSAAAVFPEPATVVLYRLPSTERRQAGIIAQDTVVRYAKLPGGRRRPTASAYHPPGDAATWRPNLRPCSRLSFGRNTDMIAADTVVRYGVDWTAHQNEPHWTKRRPR